MLKNKKFIKVVSIILLVAILLGTFGSTVMAADVTGATTNAGNTVSSVAAAGSIPSPTTPPITGDVNSAVQTILGIIQWGGIVAAVAVAMFIGIKYITASPEGKAEIKKTLGLYVAGVAILLSASGIVTFIKQALGH